MLVLTRKKGEKIVIGTGPDAIVLTLVDIRGPRIRLGFEAPKHVAIARDEIYKPPRQSVDAPTP
jgi:carbon storage regulator